MPKKKTANGEQRSFGVASVAEAIQSASNVAEALKTLPGALKVASFAPPAPKRNNTSVAMSPAASPPKRGATQQIAMAERFRQRLKISMTAEKLVISNLNETVTSVTFSTRSDAIFAAATVVGLLRVYDSTSGEVIANYPNKRPIQALRFVQPQGSHPLIEEHELLLLGDFAGQLKALKLAAPRTKDGAPVECRSAVMRAARSAEALVEMATFHWGGDEIFAIDCSGWLQAGHCRVVLAGHGADVCVCDLSCSVDDKAGGGGGGGGAHAPQLRVHIDESVRLRQFSTCQAVAIDSFGECVAVGGEAKILAVWHVGFVERTAGSNSERLPELLLSCKAHIHAIDISPDGSTLVVGTSTHCEVYALQKTQLYARVPTLPASSQSPTLRISYAHGSCASS